jgi:anhydro-N-acetylmuramic acid kinase
LLLCGGGAHNADLVKRLRRHLSGIRLCSTGDFGIDPDWVEAVLFAWLARERLAGRKQDTRAITGAREAVLLGTIAPPPAVE